ncbi:MAG: tRNA lysidine(34) synthetase TilS [Blautia sp.]|nr:tRNA lysidine(34) synthetase TilS [Blautia sp.]MCM1199815.1 tRNA lysidine(34) synthetase TilS [Bacteroides fragilis]
MKVRLRRTKDVYGEVKAYIGKYRMIVRGDTVIAGVSGGADSVCMLFLLWQLREEMPFRLSVVHVHHGVRKDAGQDAGYVEGLCRKWKIPFYLKKADMDGYARENGLSPEEAGRELRYQAFEEQMAKEGADKIAVAHNQNDRAETMLFHLFRGSGLRGLGSIRPVRERIIRPLLCLGREEIEAYLSRNGIAFCTDRTNDEDAYTRNRIRHHILSYAEEHICQNAAAHIAEAAEILAQADDFIRGQAASACDRCILSGKEEGVALDLAVFRKEEPFLQNMILLRCMEKMTLHRKDITKEHIDALQQLAWKNGSREFVLPYGLRAYKEYDMLFLEKGEKGAAEQKKESQSGEYPPIPVMVPGEVSVPGLGKISFQYVPGEEFFYKKGQNIPEKTYTKWFDYDKITTALVFRTRKMGDYLTIDSALRKKTVKEYMINEKIPKMQRERIFLLADGPHILWVPGYRISQYYKVNENTKRILQVRLKEESDG